MSACSALTRRGKPCRFPARRDTDRCINRERGASTCEASVRAARSSAIARRTPSTHLVDAVLSLIDRASIHAVLPRRPRPPRPRSRDVNDG